MERYIKTEWLNNNLIASAKNMDKVEDQLQQLTDSVIRNRNIVQSIEDKLNLSDLFLSMPSASDDPNINTLNLQSLLDKALEGRSVAIKFTDGTYALNECYIHSNTTLILSKNTILKSNNGLLFMNARRNIDNNFTEYNGNGNIIILGGEIHSHFISMIHGYNIEIKNVRMKNCNLDHFIEISASKNVLIENCDFEGMRMPSETRNYVEYIQIDGCTYDAFPRFPKGSPCFDETPNNNIIIKNCTFNKGKGDYAFLGTAIGSHSDITNSNIGLTIKNCVINNASYGGIRLYNNNKVVICNNVISDSERGILISHNTTTRQEGMNNDITIDNNKFNNINYIDIQGYFGANDACSSKLNIINNDFNKNDYNYDCINIKNSKNANIKNNNSKKGKRLFYAANCENLTIESNSSEDFNTNNISILKSKNVSILNNTMSNSELTTNKLIYICGTDGYRIEGNTAININYSNGFYYNGIYNDSDGTISQNGIVRNNKALSCNNYIREIYCASGVNIPGAEGELTICTVGDSITNGSSTYGYWQDNCVYDLPITKYYKNGYGGYCASKSSSSSYSSILDKMNDIPSADIYTVWLGTNDFSRNVPIGSITDSTGKEDSFYGGLKQIYVDLCNKKSNLPIIVFITPMKRTSTSGLAWDSANSAGHKLADYVDAIKAFCSNYACPVIDMFNISTVSNKTASSLLYDGLHPNTILNKRIGKMIKNHVGLYI